MKRVRDFLFWTLNTRVSPLAYLAAYSSLAIGFFWTFFQSLPDIQNTLIYKQGLVIGNGTWGVALFIGSILLVLGLKVKSKRLVKYGAMIDFVMWCFAGALYMGNHYWYAFLSFALVHMLTHGYFFLSASLDSLWEAKYNSKQEEAMGH